MLYAWSLYGNTLTRLYKAFALKHEKYLSLQIFNESLPVKRDVNRQPSAIQLAYHCDLIKLALDKLGKYFVLMNSGLEAWPIAKGHLLHNPPRQWVRIQRVSDDGFVTGLMQKDAVDEDDTKLAKSSEIEVFRLTIKNGIRFGAGFIEI